MCELNLTQQAFDDIIKERIGREKVKYDALRAELDAITAAHATLTAEAVQLKKDVVDLPGLRRAMLVNEVAQAKNIPAQFVSRLIGTTRDEIEADADNLLAILGQTTKAKVPPTPQGGGVPKTDSLGIITQHMADLSAAKR